MWSAATCARMEVSFGQMPACRSVPGGGSMAPMLVRIVVDVTESKKARDALAAAQLESGPG